MLEDRQLDRGRRDFVQIMGSLTVALPGLASALLFACDPQKTPPEEEGPSIPLPGSLKKEPMINAWLEILEDSRIRVFSGKIELGQGITTAIRQVAAEELHAELGDVEVILADTKQTPDEGYTAGSGSVKNSVMAIRHASANAREYLLELGSQALNVPEDSLVLKRGLVYSKVGSEQISIGRLLEGKDLHIAARAIRRPLKTRDYRFIGKAISQLDRSASVQGKPFFIQDFLQEGMLHARICRPPHRGSILKEYDQQELEDHLSQGSQIIKNGNFVAVVAQGEYQAAKEATNLAKRLSWTQLQSFGQSESFKEDLTQLPLQQEEASSHTNPPKEREEGGQVFQGSFYKPYLLHASLGPACAVARFTDGHLEVWSHSQGIFPLRRALSSLLLLDEEAIHVMSVPGAGSFGHNSADDAAAEAAFIATKLPGELIKVSWSRMDENQWESTGSAMRVDISATLSPQGKIRNWTSSVYSDSHSNRPNKDEGTLLIAQYLEEPRYLKGRGYLKGGIRNAEPYYDIENVQIEANYFQGPLRVSSLRSLGAYANIFAIESIVEEMSHSLNMDPIEFRISHLQDDRAIEVLTLLKNMVQELDVRNGEGVGHGFCRYKNNDGYCAVAAHVRVGGENDVSILQMLAAVDVGEVINFDGIRNQIEGAIIQAVSWTLLEEVTFENGVVTSSNLDSYPISRMSHVAKFHVEVIDRPGMSPFGGGEVGTPPTGAAITNAIQRASGVRIYDLPVSKSMKLA